jgi:hypothetical protein
MSRPDAMARPRRYFDHDAELRRALDALLDGPKLGWKEIRRRLVAQLGVERTPGPAAIVNYASRRRHGCGPADLPPKMVLPPRGGPLYRDAEVRSTVDLLLHDPMPVDAMRAMLLARFGPKRTPTRSALYRYVRRERLGVGYRPPELWGCPGQG